MRTEHEIKAVFSTLKRHLKDRGMTYKMVARKAHMSESNLKRILAAQSCSVGRLSEICAAADTSIFDLIMVASKERTPVYDLSAQAIDYFVENFPCLVFFRRLAGTDDTAAFLKSQSLPPGTVHSYLKDLSRLGLIEQQGRKVFVRAKGYLQIPDDSKLHYKLQKEWIPWFFQKITGKQEDPRIHLQMASTGLTEAHRIQLHQDLKDLLNKYRELGFVDQRLGSKATEPVGICVGVGPHRVGFF